MEIKSQTWKSIEILRKHRSSTVCEVPTSFGLNSPNHAPNPSLKRKQCRTGMTPFSRRPCRDGQAQRAQSPTHRSTALADAANNCANDWTDIANDLVLSAKLCGLKSPQRCYAILAGCAHGATTSHRAAHANVHIEFKATSRTLVHQGITIRHRIKSIFS